MERLLRSTLCVLAAAVLPCVSGSSALAASTHGSGHAVRHNCVFDHMTLRSPTTRCRPQARTYPAGVRTWPMKAIYSSALVFGVPYNVLLAIAQCESNLNPHASDGSHFGLFQFAPGTFQQASTALKSHTGIVARSYWNPLDSAYTAGYLFATGGSPAWTCETAQGLPTPPPPP